MSWHRFQARARLEDGVSEGRVGGGFLQLVTLCLSDDGVGELTDEQGRVLAPEPPVLARLRPSEARELAFCLLELAELADRRSEDAR
jgi:hypothetical protein